MNSNETTQAADTTEQPGLTRRQKAVAAVALGVGALGVGGLTAKVVMDMDKAPVTTTTTTESTTTTTAPASTEPTINPDAGQNGGIIITRDNQNVTIPTDGASESLENNGASVEGKGPTAVVVTPDSP